MKIFIIINNICRIGGTERAVTNLSDLLRSNYEVTIISLTSRDGEKIYYPINNNTVIKNLGLINLQRSLISKFKWFLFVKQNLEAINIPSGSVVIGTGHNINTVLGLCKFKKQGIRTIACEHIQIDTIPFLSRLLMKRIYRKLDNIVVLSKSAKQKIKTFLGIENNVLVIPNSLSFQPDKLSSLERPQIIMAGRLSPEKGYERVVHIAAFLKSNHPTWRIAIYGAGELKDVLDSLFQSYGLDNVTIHDPVPDIKEKYMESSIYIMTSYNEAMPMVVLEANSCGLPVVAFECEGTKELVKNGVNGYIVKSNDFNTFNSKLSTLIESIELRKKLGKSAYGISIQFSSEKIRQLWNQLLLN